MTSSTTTGNERSFWVIERVDTREWLGTPWHAASIRGVQTPDFGARIPCMYNSLRTAVEAWDLFCLQAGYTTKGISLPGQRRVQPGPNAAFRPAVQFRELETRSVSVYVPDGVPLRTGDD